ncbi:MAG: alcohol dehydrogenase catalytic domain-containing protein [Chloroflexi bacterium]|nr:alcohol dehydrogenase catalytic domain-containing protein [Chloroflexota bacterium]
MTTPSPAPDQLLVRIDSVGICYSDVKLINQGENHPKLKGRDLSIEPTRPGHEISFTIAAVGDDLTEKYLVGERFAIQPEVIINKKKFTYGFSFSGGLTQYQLIGPELLCTDNGPSIKKIDPGFGYAEAALLEPWGSVLASYDHTIRRLIPKRGGKMWIIGNPRDKQDLLFPTYLDYPEMIMISDISGNLKQTVIQKANNLRQVDLIQLEQYSDQVIEATKGQGFDDIVVIGPQSAKQIECLVSLINPGGVINLVGTQPLEKKVLLDAGRTHYDFISLVGNAGPDITSSYGEKHNRSKLKPEGRT